MIIAFANQKGGVGKTTSAINIAASLGVLGKKVLLCDFDPQSNATSGVGFQNKRKITLSIYDVIINRCAVKEAMLKTEYENLWLLPSTIDLAGSEIEFAEDNPSERYFRFKNTVATVEDEFDYIIIDCPPSLGILTINALCASDYIVVPMQCEYFALEGLAQLMNTVSRVKRMFNPKIDISGILVTMYDGRLILSANVLDALKEYCPGKILKTLVPRAVRLAEAASHGIPIYYFDKASKANECYMELSKEIEKKCVKL